MATVKAHNALAAEREAAEAEGIYAPTPEQMKMLRRHRDLTKRQALIEAEKAAIEGQIIAQMQDTGARALAVDGKNWVLITPVNTKKVDKDAFAATYPDIFNAYTALLPTFTKVVPSTPRKTFSPR